MAQRNPAATASNVTYTPVQQEILRALREKIEPTRSTAAYKLGLFAVASLNMLLPLAYFGLIFLVAHAMYWNHRYNSVGKGGWWMVYLGAYVWGTVTLVFLIKPLFARGSKESPPLKIKRSGEPFLFEYVEAICRTVNAPVPRTIRLVCEPNAAASFSGGVAGLVTGRMELTIGLPLVTGMSVRQLTGVLAHEFGHFSQGSGMRMSYIVRVINYWLIKIVFLRDAWDEKLVELSNVDVRLSPIMYAARFCVWLSRQLLFGLLWLGNALSCFLLRQMEFDADRYEARMVGFRTFTSSFSRLAEMNIAHQMALGDVETFHSEGRLPDNFPALIVATAPRVTPELRKQFRKFEAMRRTGLFDTHPTDRERIESARKENAVGVFQLAGEQKDPPATVLFANLDRICQGITIDFYKSALGKEFKKSLVHPVEGLIRRREAETEAGKSLDRYFQVHIPVDRPLPLDADSVKPPARPQEAARELKQAREQMLAALVEYKPLPERYDQAASTQFSTVEAMNVINCGLKYRGADFGLPDDRPETAQAKNKRARAAVQHLAARMLVFETAASERLSAALRLLQVPKVAAAVPNGAELQSQVRDLVESGRQISEIISELPALQGLLRGAAVLLSRIGNKHNPKVVESIVGQLEGMSSQLHSIHDQLKGKPYSFDHADERMTLQEFVIPFVPEPMDFGGLVGATQQLVERLFTLQVRVFARLAQAAEQVESVLGLPRLPDPTAPADDEVNAK